MKELKQQSQSQMKHFETISGVMGEVRQHGQEVVSGPAMQLSDKLGGGEGVVLREFL